MTSKKIAVFCLSLFTAHLSFATGTKQIVFEGNGKAKIVEVDQSLTVEEAKIAALKHIDPSLVEASDLYVLKVKGRILMGEENLQQYSNCSYLNLVERD